MKKILCLIILVIPLVFILSVSAFAYSADLTDDQLVVIAMDKIAELDFNLLEYTVMSRSNYNGSGIIVYTSNQPLWYQTTTMGDICIKNDTEEFVTIPTEPIFYNYRCISIMSDNNITILDNEYYKVIASQYYEGIVFSTHNVYNRITAELIYEGLGIDYSDSHINFLIPRNGFIDNAYLFSFLVDFQVPMFEGMTTQDLNIEIYGGEIEYSYPINEPQGITYKQLNIDTEKRSFVGTYQFYRALNVGENLVEFRVNIPSLAFSAVSYITITRLEGFVDENGDGLDDRTGRTDANSPAELSAPGVIMSLLERKMGTSTLTNSFNAILTMSTTTPSAPVLTLPIGDIFASATSRFYNGNNPFAGQNITFIDFSMLEDYQFGGMSVINYFRILLSMGMIWTTVLYLWRKFTPERAVD